MSFSQNRQSQAVHQSALPLQTLSQNRPLSLSVSTRSMAKLASSTTSLNLARLASNKENITDVAVERTRRPLMERTNLQNRVDAMDGYKRKGVEIEGRMQKMVRLSDESKRPKSVAPLRYPTTPRHGLSTSRLGTTPTYRAPLTDSVSGNLAAPIAPLTPRVSDSASFTVRRPTPARELLRVNKAESTSPADSPPPLLVPRPPTPPRQHMNLGWEQTQRQATNRSSVSAGIPRSFGVKADVQMSLTQIAAEESSADGSTELSSAAMVVDDPASMAARLSDPDVGAMMFPLSPGSLLSPRRVMAGTSRFRLSPSPVSPRPPFSLTSPTTLKRWPSALHEDEELAMTFGSGPGVTDKYTQEIGQPLGLPIPAPTLVVEDSMAQLSPAVIPGIEIHLPMSEDVEMGEEPPSREENVPVMTSDSSLSNSTSTRALGAMAPPSRIPVARSGRSSASVLPRSAREPIIATAVKAPAESAPPTRQKPRPNLSALPGRRPSTQPTMLNTLTSSSITNPTDDQPVRHKPSYPSSLGSGPLARQTPRMVSVPVPRSLINSLSASAESEPMGVLEPRQSPRSVSAPAPRTGLYSSTSRREGLSTETSKSIYGLSAALEKLKMKRPEAASDSARPRLSLAARTELSSAADSTRETEMEPIPASSRLNAVHRPRHSMSASSVTHVDNAVAPESGEAADRSLTALMFSTTGSGCLRGVVAFIDVFTADGADSSSIFADILKSLGARVLTRPTESCTHIIYKAGRPSTLSWYRKQDSKPHIVGITWVTRSKEKGERLAEGPFLVEVADEDVFQKRRKSMEPKALMSSLGIGSRPSSMRELDFFGLGSELKGATVLDPSLCIQQARRKSLLYAPKISSPLKKHVRKVSRDMQAMTDEDD